MKNKVTSSLLLSLGFALIMTSCKKVVAPEPMGDAGQTIVKFLDGLADTASGYNSGYKVINVDLVNTPQVLEMVEVRRDCPNNAELNKTMTVTIQDDPGAASAYNSDFEPLPVGSYTINENDYVQVVGNEYRLTLEPGQIGRTLSITLLNALALDLNKKYALGFTISSADANGKLASIESSMVVEIGVKNKYDGVYKVSGNFFHPTNAALVGPFGTATTGGDLECDMVTTGNTTLNRDYGAPVGESVIVFNSSTGNLTYFSGVKMRFEVDPVTNLVNVTNAPGFIARDASPNNCTYNPATKTFNLNYGWTSTGGQRVITEVLQYVRPR